MIGEPRFRQERLGQQHDRASFKCGREPTLERYLIDPGRAARENDRNVSAVYVLLDTTQSDCIAGYFTISNTTLVPASVPLDISKKLPRYESWGAVKLGRMARHDEYDGLGLGSILVLRAFSVALSIAERSGSFALVVDAKNERLAAWYVDRGFRALPESPLTVFITNSQMAAYLEAFTSAN
jgi:GNAT superfamily N-acetyltransferase